MGRVDSCGREPALEGPEQKAYTAYLYEHFADPYRGTSDLGLAFSRYEEMKEKYADAPGQRFWYLLAASKVRELKDRVPKEPDEARKKLLGEAIVQAEAAK